LWNTRALQAADDVSNETTEYQQILERLCSNALQTPDLRRKELKGPQQQRPKSTQRQSKSQSV
jgi:hypothetical protein